MEVDHYRRLAGAASPSGATWGKYLEISRPQKLMAYGFEQIYYPLFNDLVEVWSDLRKIVGDGGKLTLAQEKSFRRKRPGVGRYLQRQTDGSFKLDFTYSPFIRIWLPLIVAVFQPFFVEKNGSDKAFAINKFISLKLGYMFRDDRETNKSAGFLRSQLNHSRIKGRLHGTENQKPLLQSKDFLLIDGLVSDSFYKYICRLPNQNKINQFL